MSRSEGAMPSTESTVQPVTSLWAKAGLPAASLESVARVATLIAVCSYAVGYLIVVINDSARGFLETSLIRPRAITTGAVFIFLAALPISITQGTFFGRRGNDAESMLETVTRWLLGIVDYACACAIAGFIIYASVSYTHLTLPTKRIV